MNSPEKRLLSAALAAGLLWSACGMTSDREIPADAVARARELLRGVTGGLSVPDDLWGGPVEPEKVEQLTMILERTRTRAQERAAADMAAFEAEDFARLFDPKATWSDEEMEVIVAAILHRQKAPSGALDLLERAAWDEQRLLRVRAAAATAAARLGRRGVAPALLFAARVSSELVAAVDILLDAVGENREADRARLMRFRERWCGLLDRVEGEMRRGANTEGLPKLTPGDWGALARWEAWGAGSEKAPPTRGIVEDAYGVRIWVEREGNTEADMHGQAESILLEAVKEYVKANIGRVEVRRLSADVIGATRRLSPMEGGRRLLVNVGPLVKEYSYDADAKSWQCVKSYRLLDSVRHVPEWP
ncbi:MAG: hypothetical protein AB1696_01585 [Planctomycetota bacterium]